MKLKHYFLYALLVTAASCTSNGDQPQDPPTDSIPEKPKVVYPDFNEDSAYWYVKAQVDFGPRVPGTPEHQACFSFMKAEVLKYADTVYEQHSTAKTFDNKIIPIKNLIASFNPEQKKRILLCTHWDTRPFADQDTKDQQKPILGANDGGSGTGVLLEMARSFAKKKPGVGVDIVFFDSEDWGDTGKNGTYAEDSYCLGSQYWAKNPHVKGYKADYGILLDMVGAPNATFGYEEISWNVAQDIIGKVWGAAGTLGYKSYFTSFNRGAVTDDHVYVMRHTGIRTIDIIAYDESTPSRFGKYWHTHNDNMDAIDKNTLKAVGETLMKVVYEE